MTDRFSSDFFASNRQRLRELFTGTAPIVITAAGLLQRGGDSTFHFQQDASFWYFTGIDEPDIILVIDRQKEYLIVPPREQSRVAFDGAVNNDDLVHRSGIQLIFDDREGWRQLTNRLKRAKHVATIAAAPHYVDSHGFYANPARARLIQHMKDANTDLELLDLGQHVARMRSLKQPAELAAIQQAIDITLATLKDVVKPARLPKYAYEYEIEAAITQGFRSRGARGHAFDPIVAGGQNACTLHNISNNSPLSADELVVLDVGAEVDYYAADITRTVSLSVMTKRQQAVYDAVADVQTYAKALMKPGAFIRDNEQKIEHYMGEKLRELGLIQTISHEEVRRYFPHATSHFLGLNVHDVGDYTLPLEQTMVLTVEPGIYIAEEALGVRIEDDVVITADGCQSLSSSL